MPLSPTLITPNVGTANKPLMKVSPYFGGGGGATAPGSSTLFNGSQPPPRQSIVDTAKGLQNSGLIPQFKGIQGMGDDYYDMLAQQSQKRLRQKYFDDPNSMLAQRQNELKRRGIFDSEAGAAAEDNIYKSFGEEMAGLESELSTKRMESDLETSKFNTQSEQNLLNMLLSAAGDETRAGSEYAYQIYKAQQDKAKGQTDSDARLLESLSGTLGQETIDAETRDYFESLFGNYMQNKFGGYRR